MANKVDWEICPPQTANVSLDTHNLSLSCFGPPRKALAPVIIIIQGIASSAKEWPATIRGVSALARTYAYDRSGFGSSDVSPHGPTAENLAAELEELLTKARIQPPYILVCHSYGGIIAREFIHRRNAKNDIVGTVFVDANAEETPPTYPNPAVQALQRGLNTLEVTIGHEHKLEGEEWKALMVEEDDPKNGEAGRRELEFYHESGRTLAAKWQGEMVPPLLGECRVVVLHANYALDLQRIYDAGLEAGNGTVEERQAMREFVAKANELEEEMQRKMLGLSTEAKFVHVPDSGHYIHMVRPDIVVEAVKWVMDVEDC